MARYVPDDIAYVGARRCRSIGLISDSHGPVDPRILFAMKDCDLIAHAGDLGGVQPIEEISRIGRAVAVRGNNDTNTKWAKEHSKILADLPDVIQLELGGAQLIVIHGHQYPSAKARHRQLREAFPNALAVVYGHSHRMVLDTDTHPWVLNPGACGRVRTFGGPTGLVLARVRNTWAVAPLSIQKAPVR